MGLTTGWEPDLPIDDSLLRRFVFAFADRARFLATAVGGRYHRTAAADFADPNSASVYDNAVTLLQPLDASRLAAVVDEAGRFFPPERTWVLLSAWPTADLTAAGLELVGHPPFMVRMPAPFDHRTPGLRVVPALDAATLADFGRVLVAGYPMPPGGAIADPRLVGGPVRLWVGYDGDQAVAVSGASLFHGLVEVEWVAVLPEARGRGFGRLMTQHAVQSAPDLPAVLLASDDGRPVYQRLGFVPILRCTLWSRPTLSR